MSIILNPTQFFFLAPSTSLICLTGFWSTAIQSQNLASGSLWPCLDNARDSVVSSPNHPTISVCECTLSAPNTTREF